MLKKLNLGCGNDIRDGYINIDKYSNIDSDDVLKADVENLPFEKESVDEILALDIYEHISHIKSLSLLQHWSSILKSGGKLTIQSPAINVIFDKYYRNAKTTAQLKRLIEIIFGGQDYEGNCHFTVCHPDIMKEYLEECGFVEIDITYTNQNILIRCKKS